MNQKKIVKNLEIEKLTFKGFGLGFHENNPVFVRNTIPGDIIDVEITHKKGNVLFGYKIQTIEQSPQYSKPSCDVFESCGGCDWLNISYDKQLIFKEQIIKDLFRNINLNDCKIEPISSSPKINFYRNKTTLPVGKHNGIPIVGMYARMSHNIVTHTKCFLQPMIFDEISSVVKTYLQAANVKIYNEKTLTGTFRYLGIRYGENSNEILVYLITKSKKLPFTKQLIKSLLAKFPNIVGIVQNINRKPINTIIGDEDLILFGRDYIYDTIGNKKFKIHYKSFYQVNNGQTELIYDYVKTHIDPNSSIIDAFSGIGTIGIYISEKAKKLFFIESNEEAVKDAIFNCKSNKIENCFFPSGKVEEVLPKLCEKEEIDTIIFDPPRKGLVKDTMDSIKQSKIKKIIYISCNPPTQLRDIEILLDYGYKIQHIKPFDMFPHTYHIENVVILEKKSYK